MQRYERHLFWPEVGEVGQARLAREHRRSGSRGGRVGSEARCAVSCGGRRWAAGPCRRRRGRGGELQPASHPPHGDGGHPQDGERRRGAPRPEPDDHGRDRSGRLTAENRRRCSAASTWSSTAATTRRGTTSQPRPSRLAFPSSTARSSGGRASRRCSAAAAGRAPAASFRSSPTRRSLRPPTVGVVGPIFGVIGSLQAMEAVKALLGCDVCLLCVSFR